MAGVDGVGVTVDNVVDPSVFVGVGDGSVVVVGSGVGELVGKETVLMLVLVAVVDRVVISSVSVGDGVKAVVVGCVLEELVGEVTVLAPVIVAVVFLPAEGEINGVVDGGKEGG